MKHTAAKRLLAMVLAVVMVMGLGITGVSAEGSSSQSLSYTKLENISADLMNTSEQVEETEALLYEDDEMVRVTIVMEDQPALMSMGDELTLEAAREQLKAQQMEVAQTISEEVLDDQELDTVWNLTLVANAISANVEYGKISEIEKVDGVAAVFVETKYMPLGTADTNNIISQTMTGANTVQASGYTGAGTRIAIIDTGVDTDHQSFAEDSFEYALSQLDGQYDLLDVDEISSVLEDLHAYEYYDGELTADDLYVSSKIPFGFNYVDTNLDITHDNDDQGEHGSHVAGIAAANRYIEADRIFSIDNAYDFDGDRDFDLADVQALMDYIIEGTPIDNVDKADISGDGNITVYDAHLFLDLLEQEYVSAPDFVGVSGVAPDAQILDMKVFGTGGGAYDADYMAAIEDAIVLGCDSINLSLGTAYAGYTRGYSYQWYDQVMDSLEDYGVVVCISAGNEYNWADFDDAYQLMYADEAGTATVSSPSTYTTALSVASADNVGSVTDNKTIFSGNGQQVTLTAEGASNDINDNWLSLDPEYNGATYEAVFLGDPTNLFNGETQTDTSIYAASVEDFEGYDLTGKVVFVARGNEVSFADKHSNSALAGAAAVVIYNNVSGMIYAALDGSTATIPCATISMEDAKAAFELASQDEDGHYTGKITVARGLVVDWGDENASITMSDFSSWGTTGDLKIKPEVTAPGGAIFSVNGADKDGNAYESMSGTSMAAPHTAGIAALAAQYIRENELAEEGVATRRLVQSLMMSTAVPVIEEETGVEYSVRNQGAGLVNIQNVVSATSYVMVDGQPDGKVKAELGDGTDDRTFSFTIYNYDDSDTTFDLSASILTTGTTYEDGHALSTDGMTKLNADVKFSTGNTVTVAAGSSKKVSVTISVPEATAEAMKAKGYTNGFYIEGYVYAEPRTNAEGLVGVAHSIPLLGWYGNWTDPSMYDTGSYIDFYYDTAERPSHIMTAIDNSGYYTDPDQKNMLAWTVADYDYGLAYSGNVYNGGTTANGEYGGDSQYIEARNAINVTSDRYWQVYGVFPTLTRNIVDADLFITDESGNVLYREDYEGFVQYGNFYYSSYSAWLDFTTASGLTIDDWSWAENIPEGTKLTITLGVAPEYYIDADEYADSFVYEAYYGDEVYYGCELDDDVWTNGTIGDGAFISYTFTVDNTAPDLADVDAPLYYEDGKLNFTVQDNQYIAAVILLDANGRTAKEYYYPDMDEGKVGQAITGSFDLSDYTGSRAVLAICDYAGNETYYSVNLNGEQGESYADLVAFQYGDGWYNDYAAWVTFDTNVDKNEITLYNDGIIEMVAAEYVNGYILAQDSNGKLYGINYQDFLTGAITDLETTYITTLENVYQDFAYSYKEGKLYGLVTTEYDGYPTSEIISINLNGSYWDDDRWKQVEAYDESSAVSRGGLYGLGMAIDDDGTIYVMGSTYDWDTEEMSETAHLWSVGLEYNQWSYQWQLGWQMTDLGDSGLPMDYLQSMTWNHNDETLYWAQFSDPRADITLQEVEVLTDEESGDTTVKCTKVGTLSTETCAMFAPLTAATAAKEEHSNVPVFDSRVIGTPILSAHSLTMGKNTTQNLSVNFEPWYTGHKTVVWSSDDETVATVDQKGKVTAVGEGTCTITVANVEDETKFDTCKIAVAAISANIEGIVSYAPENIMAFGDSRHYDFTLDKGVSDVELGEGLTFSEELSDAFKAEYGEDADISQSYELDITAATMGRDGYLWVSEGSSNGMFYKVDPETMEVVEILEPIGGDFTYSIKYNEENDTFSTVSNYWMFTNMDMDEEMYDKLHEMVNNGEDYTTYHRVDLSTVLAYSDTGFDTGEHTGVNYDLDIVVSAMEIIHEPYTYEMGYDYKDFMGNNDWNKSGANYAGINYTTDTTYVLLDNVGRLWYIDEIPGFKTYTMEYEDTDWTTGETFIATTTYYYTADDVYLAMEGEGMMFEGSNLPKGMIFMEDVDENGNGIATCYYVRELVETPLTDMYRVGTMPRISYHYCDLYYAGTTDEGAPLFFMSLYDFHNEGKTNQFYLYVGGMGTGEWGYDDDWNYVELMTDPVLYELGNSGDYRVIALITSAEYIGGLPATKTEETDTYTARTFVTPYSYKRAKTK